MAARRSRRLTYHLSTSLGTAPPRSWLHLPGAWPRDAPASHPGCHV